MYLFRKKGKEMDITSEADIICIVKLHGNGWEDLTSERRDAVYWCSENASIPSMQKTHTY